MGTLRAKSFRLYSWTARRSTPGFAILSSPIPNLYKLLGLLGCRGLGFRV